MRQTVADTDRELLCRMRRSKKWIAGPFRTVTYFILTPEQFDHDRDR